MFPFCSSLCNNNFIVIFWDRWARLVTLGSTFFLCVSFHRNIAKEKTPVNKIEL